MGEVSTAVPAEAQAAVVTGAASGRSGRGGRIADVTGDARRVGSSGETVYAGAKGGGIPFAKSVAREVAPGQVLSVSGGLTMAG